MRFREMLTRSGWMESQLEERKVVGSGQIPAMSRRLISRCLASTDPLAKQNYLAGLLCLALASLNPDREKLYLGLAHRVAKPK